MIKEILTLFLTFLIFWWLLMFTIGFVIGTSRALQKAIRQA